MSLKIKTHPYCRVEDVPKYARLQSLNKQRAFLVLENKNALLNVFGSNAHRDAFLYYLTTINVHHFNVNTSKLIINLDPFGNKEDILAKMMEALRKYTLRAYMRDFIWRTTDLKVRMYVDAITGLMLHLHSPNVDVEHICDTPTFELPVLTPAELYDLFQMEQNSAYDHNHMTPSCVMDQFMHFVKVTECVSAYKFIDRIKKCVLADFTYIYYDDPAQVMHTRRYQEKLLCYAVCTMKQPYDLGAEPSVVDYLTSLFMNLHGLNTIVFIERNILFAALKIESATHSHTTTITTPIALLSAMPVVIDAAVDVAVDAIPTIVPHTYLLSAIPADMSDVLLSQPITTLHEAQIQDDIIASDYDYALALQLEERSSPSQTPSCQVKISMGSILEEEEFTSEDEPHPKRRWIVKE